MCRLVVSVLSDTIDPSNLFVVYGQDATLVAAAGVDPAPTVQWQVSTDGGTTWSNIPGATSTTLTVTAPTLSLSGNKYRAVFTNSCGGTQAATATAASLTVNKADTTTTIASDSPDPSLTGQSYVVQWTVSVNSPGSGTPTGTVTITGGSGCSAPVGAGQCTVTSSTAGAITLTASYGGDSNFNSSSGTASHQVNANVTPSTATVTTPADGSMYRAATVPASFSGSAADGTGGSGLNANSTTLTLQRNADNFYWTGTAWQAGAFNLATTHSATTGTTVAAWTSSATLPTWASESDGVYMVQATATNTVGNSVT